MNLKLNTILIAKTKLITDKDGDKNKLATAVGAFLMSSAILTLVLPIALVYIGTIAGIIFTIILITGIIALVIYIKLINK